MVVAAPICLYFMRLVTEDGSCFEIAAMFCLVMLIFYTNISRGQ